MRHSGRDFGEMREVIIEMDCVKRPMGSARISIGDTQVICTCSVEDKVPPFLNHMNQGWITAEYGMLPGATNIRTAREAARGKQSGRTVEIQRLIGRSLRSIVNPSLLGTRTFLIDCDVLQADGGTRTASITGGFLALTAAIVKLMDKKLLPVTPLHDCVAAISVGVVDGVPCLDLDYKEDSRAEVDMNLVMTGRGKYVEIQGTAEKTPFDADALGQLQTLGARGVSRLVEIQKEKLAARSDIEKLFPAQALNQ